MKTRRGISADIIECDGFIDMPASAQALYMHLILACDDEGFTSKMRLCKIAAHASDDDEKILSAKGFIIQFKDEYKVVTVIKHWWTNNYLRSERVIKSEFAERELVYKKKNGVYTLDAKDGLPLPKEDGDNQVSPTCHPTDTPTIHNNTYTHNNTFNTYNTSHSYQEDKDDEEEDEMF